ncbi:ribulose-phosphate 3-epimerase [Micrococcales bacterium 31B]|nr:ribulose-phosphate 3-epimerase [Micrococcales bacterium 31B]
MTRINPSILNSDFMHLAHELGRIETADWAHVDVMDGHFVPNLTFGLPVVEQIVKASPVPIDAHLMIEDADHWAPLYAEVGCQSVTMHAEATRAPLRLARHLRGQGVRAGLGLRPATDVSAYADFIGEFDMVLIMTVEPGFGGQSFLDSMLPKIERTREAIKRSGAEVWLQVDGGVSAQTIERCAAAGADTFVAGSAVYGAEDAAAQIATLRSLAARHAH